MSYRVIELPPALCPTSTPAVQILCQRDQVSTAYGQFWIGKNYALTGVPPDSYTLAQSFNKFAWHGKLTANYTDQTLCIDTRLGATVQLDGPDQILDEVSDFDAMTGSYVVFIDNEIMFLLQPTLTAAGAYTLPLIRGQYGTAVAAHAAGVDVYILPAAALAPLPLPVRVGNTGQFKVTLGVQNLSDQAETDLVFTGQSSTPGPVTGLTLNGSSNNAVYDGTDPIAIAWTLPPACSDNMTLSYTLLEFVVDGIVTETQQVPWPLNTLSYTYPPTAPAACTLQATLVFCNGWETLSSPSVQLNAYQFTSS